MRRLLTVAVCLAVAPITTGVVDIFAPIFLEREEKKISKDLHNKT